VYRNYRLKEFDSPLLKEVNGDQFLRPTAQAFATAAGFIYTLKKDTHWMNKKLFPVRIVMICSTF
jgi:hypothetical protein